MSVQAQEAYKLEDCRTKRPRRFVCGRASEVFFAVSSGEP